MALVRLLIACVILPICLAQEHRPDRHSLYYVYTSLSKAVSSPGIFEFAAMGLLDDRKIDYYNSENQIKTPEQPWMSERLPEDYWTKGTQSRKSKEQWFKVNVDILMQRMRQNGSDIHSLMWKHGCEGERQRDGTFKFVKGVDQYSYDGEDFLAFDDGSLSWVAPVKAAEQTKHKWDSVPILNHYTKGYLEKECVEWLGKFVKYSEEFYQEQISHSPPELHTFTSNANSEDSVNLVCMATGFYPKDIVIRILQKGVVVKSQNEPVLPNGDGTHQIRASVEAKKSEKSQYSCQVIHETLDKPLEVVWAEDSTLNMGIVGAIIGVIVTLVIIILGILCILGYLGIVNAIPFSRLKRAGSSSPPSTRDDLSEMENQSLMDNPSGRGSTDGSNEELANKESAGHNHNSDSGKGSTDGSCEALANNEAAVGTENEAPVVNVTYATKEQAIQAIKELNGKPVRHVAPHILFIPEEIPEGKGQHRPNNGQPAAQDTQKGPCQESPDAGVPVEHKHSSIPLRLLVPTQYMSAIIGKEGATISKITKQTHSKIDVHHEEQADVAEKPISIHSTPEGCSAACRLILDIMQKEAENTKTADEVSLKILAHNNFVDLVMENLKKVEEYTQTKITISPLEGLTLLNPERTITVEGSIAACCLAEQEIMKSVRKAYDNDTDAYNANLKKCRPFHYVICQTFAQQKWKMEILEVKCLLSSGAHGSDSGHESDSGKGSTDGSCEALANNEAAGSTPNAVNV